MATWRCRGEKIWNSSLEILTAIPLRIFFSKSNTKIHSLRFKMSDEKIVFLGGGSPFIPSLIYAILENKETLDGSEIWLMDIDPSHLPMLTRVGKELSKRNKANMKFISTTDPKEALEGATFVMPAYRIGGLQHMKYDIEIPTKHGICGDETSGPGGTFMAQCTIPATLEYCRMIEDLCPGAWVISYVNPVNSVADAVRRETNVKFISICDAFAGFSMEILPRLLNMPPFKRRYCVSDDLKPRAIGVNHNTWLVDLRVNGEDGYPLLRELLKEFGEAGLGSPDFLSGLLGGEVPEEQIASLASSLDCTVRLFEAHGYLSLGLFHERVYWDYNEIFKERREKGAAHEETALGWSEDRLKFIEELLGGSEYEVCLRQRPYEYCFGLFHSRQAIGIIVSMINDEGREWGGINFPNRGAITNLPSGSTVEGACMVDKRGITPIAMGDLPKSFLGLTQHLINWQELTVDAALSGDKSILYQALLACPYVHDMKVAKVIMDEPLEAHAEYMPQFKGKERIAGRGGSFQCGQER